MEEILKLLKEYSAYMGQQMFLHIGPNGDGQIENRYYEIGFYFENEEDLIKNLKKEMED